MGDRDWRIFREDFDIRVKGGKAPLPLRFWEEANLPSSIMDAIRELGYEKPSPIQRQVRRWRRGGMSRNRGFYWRRRGLEFHGVRGAGCVTLVEVLMLFGASDVRGGGEEESSPGCSRERGKAAGPQGLGGGGCSGG